MHRFVLVVLTVALVGVLPVWRFNSQWGYGPAIVVGFLLLVNLAQFLGDRLGRSHDKT
jgi:hypothetical protein